MLLAGAPCDLFMQLLACSSLQSIGDEFNLRSEISLTSANFFPSAYFFFIVALLKKYGYSLTLLSSSMSSVI